MFGECNILILNVDFYNTILDVGLIDLVLMTFQRLMTTAPSAVITANDIENATTRSSGSSTEQLEADKPINIIDSFHFSSDDDDTEEGSACSSVLSEQNDCVTSGAHKSKLEELKCLLNFLETVVAFGMKLAL